MKMIAKIFILFLLIADISSVHAKPAYLPSQLEQFNETGKCPGCDLSEANFYAGKHYNSDLSNALLVRLNARYASFYESDFTQAQMTEAGLYEFKASGSNFTNANLAGAYLRLANLSSCNFTGANLSGADLSKANLVRAVITKEQLESAKTILCAILPDGSVYMGEGDHC